MRISSHFSTAGVSAQHGLLVQILHTSPEASRRALAQVHEYLRGLDGAIEVLVVRAVPYPLPLDRPHFDVDTLTCALREQAAAFDCPVSIRLFLAREAFQALQGALHPGAVLAMEKTSVWWPSRMRSWARSLARAGHRVLLIN